MSVTTQGAPAPPAAVIDWELAARTARRLSGSGPAVTEQEARSAVVDLRACAAEAVAHVAEYTGLVAAADPGLTVVVDRGRWIQANLDGLAGVIEPALALARSHRAAVTPRIGGVELGVALGFLSQKVLGQFELFTDPGAPPRLLLVAPNIVAAESKLDVDPHEFRLWVTLHEEAHRVQFSAVEWLGPWLRAQVSDYLASLDLDPKVLGERLRRSIAAATGAARGLDVTEVMRAFLTPEQRDTMDRLTAVMSLLEGHADVVMDGAGRTALTSVTDLRESFQRRRNDPSPVEAVARRLLGLNAKLAQYRDGAAFVRTVVDRVGMDRFNEVWQSPETLPTRSELHDPSAWLLRMA
jgi:coenzyme F420 biosynthesis associated uncharacterized protein